MTAYYQLLLAPSRGLCGSFQDRQVPVLAAFADEFARDSVLTSAGVAAGIDLCLHIIRADAGAGAANQRARALAAPHRSGGQAQYIDRRALPPRAGGLDQVRTWALRHLDELLESGDAPMEAVARRCGLGTPANLRTLFKRHLGVPPSAYRDTFHRRPR
jgi:transcriptional regulator GlxA family with amidase domain